MFWAAWSLEDCGWKGWCQVAQPRVKERPKRYCKGHCHYIRDSCNDCRNCHCVCVHASLCVYVCACMCICLCMYMCMCYILCSQTQHNPKLVLTRSYVKQQASGYLGSSTRCQPVTGDHFQTSVVYILSSEWFWMQLWGLLKVLCVVSHLFIFLLPSESNNLRKLCIIGVSHWFFKIKIIPNILGN